jgi:hypothetical protein
MEYHMLLGVLHACDILRMLVLVVRLACQELLPLPLPLLRL